MKIFVYLLKIINILRKTFFLLCFNLKKWFFVKIIIRWTLEHVSRGLNAILYQCGLVFQTENHVECFFFFLISF